MKTIKNFYSDLKRNIIFIAINIISLSIALYLFSKNQQPEILTAILAVGISLSIGYKQLQIENDKMFKELFIKFTSTYDEKYNNTLNEIEDKYKSNNLYELEKNEKSLLIDYLNFCAEEYLWYTKNRIDEDVWKSWRNGMLYFFNIPPINSFVLKEKGQADSYYGLFHNIRKSITNWK